MGRTLFTTIKEMLTPKFCLGIAVATLIGFGVSVGAEMSDRADKISSVRVAYLQEYEEDVMEAAGLLSNS